MSRKSTLTPLGQPGFLCNSARRDGDHSMPEDALMETVMDATEKQLRYAEQQDLDYVEHISRQTLPHWLRSAVQRAEGMATISSRACLPVLVVHEIAERYADDLVILPRSAFLAWVRGWYGNGDDVLATAPEVETEY